MSVRWFLALGLGVLGLVLSQALAASGDVAPGAPELLEAEQRVRNLQVDARAVGVATQRLQVAWTRLLPSKLTCPPEHLELGWRIERFGAAWRELGQSVKAASARLEEIRAAPTASPLLDDTWFGSLNGLLADSLAIQRGFLESSAWQQAFVRPTLARCEVAPLESRSGFSALLAPVRGAHALPVAVLAVADGRVCPGELVTDGGVLLLEGGQGCWTSASACSCVPVQIEPGAVLGPPPEVVEVSAEQESAKAAPEKVAKRTKKSSGKKSKKRKKKKKTAVKAPGPGL